MTNIVSPQRCVRNLVVLDVTEDFRRQNAEHLAKLYRAVSVLHISIDLIIYAYRHIGTRRPSDFEAIPEQLGHRGACKAVPAEPS